MSECLYRQVAPSLEWHAGQTPKKMVEGSFVYFQLYSFSSLSVFFKVIFLMFIETKSRVLCIHCI